MKVTRIRIVGPTPQIDLPIVELDPFARYLLKAADGLGPPDLDLSISSSLYEGGEYRGRRSLNREVVLRIGLQPDYEVGEEPGDLRDELYGMLSNGQLDESNIQLWRDETLVGTISYGYVKQFQINPFSKEPEVQVTIACTSPYINVYPPANSSMSTSPKTAFPIENGTAPAGFKLTIKFTAAQAAGWTLTRGQGYSAKKMFIDYPFLTDDTLEIDTRPGTRGIWVTRASVRTNILWALSNDSEWLMLHGKTNTMYTSDQNFIFQYMYLTKQNWGI